MKLRRISLALIALLALAVAWLALDDITTGREPGFAAEWTALAACAAVLAGVAWAARRGRRIP